LLAVVFVSVATLSVLSAQLEGSKIRLAAETFKLTNRGSRLSVDDKIEPEIESRCQRSAS
jgi:hypothetical protein